jgi:hypothetical protein
MLKSIHSICFKIPEAERANAITWSGCSRAKPTTHTGFRIVFFILVLVFWTQCFAFGSDQFLWSFNVYPENCKSGDFVYIIVTAKNNSTKPQKIIPFYSRDNGLLSMSIRDKITGGEKSLGSSYDGIRINYVELPPKVTRLCCFDFIQVAVPDFVATNDRDNFWKKLTKSEHEYWLTCSLNGGITDVKNFEKKLLIDKITTERMNTVKKALSHIRYGEMNAYCIITDLQAEECRKLYQNLTSGTLKNYFKMNYLHISITNKISVGKEGQLHPKSYSANLTKEQRKIAFNDLKKWLLEVNPTERLFLVAHSLVNIGVCDDENEDNIRKNYRLLLEKTLETDAKNLDLKFDLYQFSTGE